MKTIARLTLLTLALMGLLACSAPAADPTPAAEPTAAPVEPAAATTNLTTECVTDYQEGVDYFPEKAAVEYATGWQVAYHNNYKIVTVTTPWQDATESFTYVLVQCGTPAPTDVEGVVVEVPIATVATMSTTYLAHLQSIGRLPALVGHDSFAYVTTPEVRGMIEAGQLVEIGGGAEVNVELVLDTQPDMVMTYGLGAADYDAFPKLQEAGITTVLNGDYMEQSPLGRAEWLKFMALFFNEEATATAAFAPVAAEYNRLVQLTQSLSTRPSVVVNAPWGDSWYMAGGQSYMALLLQDAGANYLWASDENAGGVPLSFEAVYDEAAEADFWLNPSSYTTQEEMLSVDERFGDFAAFANNQIYNNTLVVNEFGGNAFWESGAVNPQLILADLIAILHPDLLPDHQFAYYAPVQ